MKTQTLWVTSLKGELFKGKVRDVFVESVEGELGILPGHMPVTVLLKPGALRYHTELGEAHFYVSGGTLQAKENEVMVLADIIERADSIDIVAAEKAMSDAKKLLAGKLDEAEHHKHQLEWVEALAKLRVARLQSGR